MNTTATRPILYFDGECNLCNGVVQFVIRHDRQGRFLFATQQGAAGQAALAHVAAGEAGSVILFYNGRYYTRSAAVLHVARLLGGLWPLFYVFIVIPPFIRNAIYDLVARNRYKWFGRRDACMLPTPELRERFL